MTNAKNLLFQKHDHLTERAYWLMLYKNADYSGDQDPFANFRLSEKAGLGSAQQGILIRMLDKVSRLSTHVSGKKLATDSMKDSVIDIINYAVLFYALDTEGEQSDVLGDTEEVSPVDSGKHTSLDTPKS